jgi:hypothetical protein
MSRFSRQIGNTLYLYGFDTTLYGYFFGAYDQSVHKGMSDQNCFFNVSSYFSLKPHPSSPDQKDYSNSEILDIIELHPNAMAKEHIECIILDKPL